RGQARPGRRNNCGCGSGATFSDGWGCGGARRVDAGGATSGLLPVASAGPFAMSRRTLTALGDAGPLPSRVGSGHRHPHPNSRRSGFGRCHGEPHGASIAKYLPLPPPSPHIPAAATLEAERRRRRARRRQRRRGGRPAPEPASPPPTPRATTPAREPATSSGIGYGRRRSKGCSRAAPTSTEAGAHNSRSTAAMAAAAATACGLHLKPTLSSRWRYVWWESGPSCLHVRRNRRRGCGDVAQHA
ncbi:unnamed protein product, partial [Urochloa humidicola]